MNRLFDKYPKLFVVLLIALGSLIATVKTAEVITMFTSPTDENYFRNGPDGVMVFAVLENGASERAGIKVGDIILSINDQTFETASQATRVLRQAKPGDIIKYDVRRGNETLHLKVVLAKFGIDWAVLFSLVITIATIGVGWFVALTRPENNGARITAMSLVVLSPAFSLTQQAHTEIGQSLFLVSVFIGFPLIAHSLLYVPIRVKDFDFKIKWIRVWYVLGAIMLMSASSLFYNIGFTLKWPMMLYLLISSVIWVWLRRGRDKHVVKTQQPISYALLTFLASALIVWMLILSELGRYSLYLFLVSGVVPAAYLYSITKYRFFGITKIVRRSLSYTAASSVLVFLSLIGLINLFAFLTKIDVHAPIGIRFSPLSIRLMMHDPLAIQEAERFIYILIGCTVIVISRYIIEKVKLFLDKRFHRLGYNYKDALSDISGVLSQRLSEKVLSESIAEEVLKLMQLKGAAIYLRSGSRQVESDDKSVGENEKYVLGAAKGTCQRLINAGGVEADLYRNFSELLVAVPVSDFQLPTAIEEAQVQVVVPLLIKDKTIGLLLLGEKLSEEVYKQDDLDFIESLARQTAIAFENSRLYKEDQERSRMKRELEFARKVQQELLPQDIPDIPGLQVKGYYFAAGEVGGDYYDVITAKMPERLKRKMPNHFVTILVGDVAGKGVSAAMYMARVQGIIRTLSCSGLVTPKDLIEKTNSMLFSRDMRRSFVTMICAKFDTKTKTVNLVRAGHLPLLWYSTADQNLHVVKPSGMAIGLDAGVQFKQSLEEHCFGYAEGDLFVFFSDGITEAKNPSGEEFGMERLMSLVTENKDRSPDEIVNLIYNQLIDFARNVNPYDDITLLVIKAVPVSIENLAQQQQTLPKQATIN
ncbi:MAG: SpoIIE family protein phosphatase [Chlorobiales bacterium]|nr:SpoIIE family protein phosphatase [Chlorobiales bacterium]